MSRTFRLLQDISLECHLVQVDPMFSRRGVQIPNAFPTLVSVSCDLVSCHVTALEWLLMINLRWLDCDTPFLFIFACVCESSFSGFGTSNDTSFTDEGVSQCGLAMIYVSNHRHVADVVLLVHDLTDLVCRKIHLNWKTNICKNSRREDRILGCRTIGRKTIGRNDNW